MGEFLSNSSSAAPFALERPFLLVRLGLPSLILGGRLCSHFKLHDGLSCPIRHNSAAMRGGMPLVLLSSPSVFAH